MSNIPLEEPEAGVTDPSEGVCYTCGATNLTDDARWHEGRVYCDGSCQSFEGHDAKFCGLGGCFTDGEDCPYLAPA